MILASEHDPRIIRRLFKRWLGESLSEKYPLPDGATWWAECGSIRWITDDAYYANALRYALANELRTLNEPLRHSSFFSGHTTLIGVPFTSACGKPLAILPVMWKLLVDFARVTAPPKVIPPKATSASMSPVRVL